MVVAELVTSRAVGYTVSKAAEFIYRRLENTVIANKVIDLFESQVYSNFPAVIPFNLGILTGYFGKDSWLSKSDPIEVETIKNASKDRPYLYGPAYVKGTYMPGSLLISGWWERTDRKLDPIKWTDNSGIQSWLWNGFEQWAPSWDSNLWHDGDSSDILFGQIGMHDEADSIPVIIEAGAKARQVREEMTALISSKGCLVSNAVIRGELLSAKQMRAHSDKAVRKVAERLANTRRLIKNCIVVRNDSKDHRVELRTKEPVELYSGYLWKCVCPKMFLDKKDALLDHSYFAWEHTNFANRDAINYNLDALDHKLVYIAEKRKQGGSRNDLSLLQHMMPQDRLRGDPGGRGYELPEITTDEFMAIFPRQNA
jgi:hypothetical protein